MGILGTRVPGAGTVRIVLVDRSRSNYVAGRDAYFDLETGILSCSLL